MSLSSLARDEILRKPTDLRSAQAARVTIARLKIANQLNVKEVDVTPLNDDLLELAVAPPFQETKATSVMDDLVKYIPTESVTLYVAAVSAWDALQDVLAITAEGLYWFFGVLTPILFLLIYAGKRRSNGLAPFPPLSEWPWWKLIASTVAFLTWALAVPNGPYLEGDNGGAVAALAALFVSMALSLVAAVVEKPAP